jgi:hypothetical protein
MWRLPLGRWPVLDENTHGVMQWYGICVVRMGVCGVFPDWVKNIYIPLGQERRHDQKPSPRSAIKTSVPQLEWIGGVAQVGGMWRLPLLGRERRHHHPT